MWLTVSCAAIKSTKTAPIQLSIFFRNHSQYVGLGLQVGSYSFSLFGIQPAEVLASLLPLVRYDENLKQFTEIFDDA